MVNEEIIREKVMLVTSEGNKIELSKAEALEQAYTEGMDLVQVSEQDELAICKVMDYAKFVYDQNKKSRHKEKRVDLKEIKLTWKISPHDLETKVNNAKRIITKDKDRVKFIVVFKGREVRMQSEGHKLLNNIAEMMESVATKSSNIKVEGANVSVMFEPKK